MLTSRFCLSNYCVHSAVNLAKPDTVQKTLLPVRVENVTPDPRPHIQYHCTDCSIHMKVNSYENKSQIFNIVLFLYHSSLFQISAYYVTFFFVSMSFGQICVQVKIL